MAIAVAQAVAPASVSGAGGTTCTTGSFTPTANAFLVAVTTQRANAALAVSTITGTLGLTWTKRSEVVNTAGTERFAVAIWTAPVGGSPTSGTVTATWDAGNQIALQVLQVTGQAVSAPYTQQATATGIAADLTVTLGAAPAATSAVIGGISSSGGTGITPDADYTEVAETSLGGLPSKGQTQYKVGSADTTVAWSTLGASNNAGAAIEIAAAPAGQNVVGQITRGGAWIDAHGWITRTGAWVAL